ncbi:MAG: transglycosylase domain-containing protein [Leptospiraceae bacterium]|nr:transglycosylase domain-containing protein [Leptospiraceae bacterium]MCP5501449.1 transglycosylase domain-containing protein [Leptospiraceae bacterium]
MTKRRFLQKIFKVIVGTIICILSILSLHSLFLTKNSLRGDNSFILYSSEGIEIQETLNSDGEYSRWIDIKEYPKELIEILLIAEDKHFYYHPGIDLFSILRAFFTNIKAGKIRSGASTIPQQLARLVWKKSIVKNQYIRKLQETYYALLLKLRFSNQAILEAYMNQIPFPFQSQGFFSASRRILKKDIHFITKEEGIGLVVLIRNPYTVEEKYKKRYLHLKNKICPRTCRNELPWIKQSIFGRNVKIKIKQKHSRHYADWIRSIAPDSKEAVYSYFSNDLNLELYKILTNELRQLEAYRAEEAALLVLKVEEENLKLISFIGSSDYESEEAGQVKGNMAIRNAGSTLKTFVYGLGMEKFHWLPNTIFMDEEVSAISMEGTFRPKNNDRKYWGKITLREALASSRNVTAIRALQQVGIEDFYKLLKQQGFSHLQEAPEYYGTGLALGVGGVSLFQLTYLYSSLSTGGVRLPILIGRQGNKEIEYGEKKRVFRERTACILSHILSDKEARRRAFGRRNFLDFPYRVAAKTGTSKDYRDSWAVGYTPEYIVGAWVGNFSGKPMKKISGAVGAGRIFQQIIRHLHRTQKPRFSCFEEYEKIKLCRFSGKIAGPQCAGYDELKVDSSKLEKCKILHSNDSSDLLSSDRVTVLSPSPGEIYLSDETIGSQKQEIPLKIILPQKLDDRYTYRLNDDNRVLLNGNIERLLSLHKGLHRFRLYKSETVIEEFTFEIK